MIVKQALGIFILAAGPILAADSALMSLVPADAKVVGCWAGVEGLSPCSVEGSRVTWTIPRIAGGKTTAGPFVSVLGTAALKPGKFDVKSWIDAPGVIPQGVTLEKK